MSTPRKRKPSKPAVSKSKSTLKAKSSKKARPVPSKLTSRIQNRVVAPSKPKSKPRKPAAKPAPQLTNHVALVIDNSGSMRNLRAPVVDVFNNNLATIKEEVYKNTTWDGKSTQVTTLTSVFFSDSVDKRFVAKPVDTLGRMRVEDYSPVGGTALLQAVGETIEALERLPGANNKTTSFLVITITDGEENESSVKWKTALAGRMKQCTATDRWSFVFLVPDESSKRALIQDFGVAEGNVSVWAATLQGTREAGNSVMRGISTYYTSRAAGKAATIDFFGADLSKVSKKDLSKLDDLSSKTKILPVNFEQEIKPFVEGKTGEYYVVGGAFYELTKNEKVQRYKKIAIKERNGKKIYGGDDARQLLGLPSDQDVKLKIENLATYQVFVQSTSVNRKLVRGSTVLYIPSLA